MKDRISVLLPTYNRAHFLSQALDSILNNTFPPYEIVICDDYSTDGTRDIISSYQRNYPEVIRPVLQQRNVGIPRNLNSGLRAVRGDFISLMADDDYYYPRKLELELEAIQSSRDAKWAYSGVDVITASGKRLWGFVDSRNAVEGNIFEDILFRRVSPRHYLMATEAQRKVGFFDESLIMYEDWDFKIRLAKHFDVVYVPEVLTVYRIHEAGIHKMDLSVHIDQMSKVIEKARALLDDLPRSEVERIESRFRDIMLERWVEYAASSGKRWEAWGRLCKRLIEHPFRAAYHKLLLKLFLPPRMYSLGVRGKRLLGRVVSGGSL